MNEHHSSLPSEYPYTRYRCGGCDRRGVVAWRRGWYDCPVCRFRWEIPENSVYRVSGQVWASLTAARLEPDL